MKLRIEPAPTGDREQLRALLIDAAEQLAGIDSKVLEPKLPWDGQPILVADKDLHPVLISFDPQQSQSALLSGLQGIEQLTAALPWVNQVYDVLQQRRAPPKLVVVSSEFPPGAETVLTDCPNLKIFRCQVLRVNDATGLWLEQLNDNTRQADRQITPQLTARQVNASPVKAVERSSRSEDKLPALSNEEAAYFQQL